MRIGIDAHMIGLQETGNERYILELVSALARVNQDDNFVVIGQKTLSGRIGGFPNVQIVPLSTTSQIFRLLVELPQIAKRERLDLLHVTYNAPLFCPCPTVVTVHDLSFEKHPGLFSLRDRLILKTMVPRSILRAKKVIAVSETTRRDLIEIYGLSPEKVAVTFEAASEHFRPPNNSQVIAGVLSKYNLTPPYILAVGSGARRKNLKGLLQAFRELRQTKHIPHQLVLSGPISQTPSGDKVLYTGFVAEEDLPAIYSGAEVLVYPSLYEGFGLPVLEAMSCGTPVVASNVAAIAEVADGAALLVEPSSTSAIAQAIWRVISDPALRDELKRKGLARSSHFSWETTARQTLEIYHTAI